MRTLITLSLSALLGGALAQPAPSAAETLILSAVPGTQVEYVVSYKMRLDNLQFSYVPQPGVTLSAKQQAELTQMNDQLTAQLPQFTAALEKAAQSSQSKEFIKVLPRDERGNSVLQTTLITPGQNDNVAKIKTFTTTKLIQTIAPDGHILKLNIQTNDPQLQRVYNAMNSEELLKKFNQNGQGDLYGLTLRPGETRGSTQTLDVGALLGGLGALMGGASFKAQPLTMNVATTYLGKSATGVRSYQQSYTSSPWKVSVSVPSPGSKSSALDISATSSSGQGGQSYRPDGLPQTSDSVQTIGMVISSDLPDMPARSEFRVDMIIASSLAAR